MSNTPKFCEILQPASHGFTLNTELGARRTHVRIFNFVNTEFQGGFIELPAVLEPHKACALLEEALVELRRYADQMDAYKSAPFKSPICPGYQAPTEVEKPKPFQDRLMSAPLRKVLALDVDGVLNQTPAELGSLMPEQLKWLNLIVQDTGCLIVVISSWRRSEHQMAKLSKVLNDMGCAWELAPLFDTHRKEDELDWWLKQRDNVRLCILDDEPLIGFHLCQVQTLSDVGLDASKTGLVIQMLNP